MSETQLATTDIVERVLIAGDLSRLTPQDRVAYYAQTCKSLGLNPLTKPFEYITLNGKLTLYARKDATDQLRKINSVSIGKPDVQQVDDLIIVTVTAIDKTGRTDSDLGVVRKSDMRGDIANAMMKAVTKAKRRVTLSICGLGMLDETEVETIPDAKPVIVAETGEIVTPASNPQKLGRNDAAIESLIDGSAEHHDAQAQPEATNGNGSPVDAKVRLTNHRDEAALMVSQLSQANHEDEANALDKLVRNANTALLRNSSAGAMHSQATMLKSKIEEYGKLIPQPA